MITSCTGCQTRYRLDDAKVPQRLIRVRCPRCQQVFQMDGTQAAAQVEKPDDKLVLERTGDRFQFGQKKPSGRSGGADMLTQAATPDPTQETSPFQADAASGSVGPDKRSQKPSVRPAAQTEPDRQGATPAAPETGKSRRRGRDKERMLARALVSDILVYNQELRDKSLEDGTLLEKLGPEIKKSWELYKDRVTPEVANSTTHFRDALNEILANGQKIF